MQTLDERARDASRALRAAADLRPRPEALQRRRAGLRVALTGALVVVAASIGAVVAFHDPSPAPTGPSGGPKASAADDLRSVIRDAPYHVLVPTSAGLTLLRAAGRAAEKPETPIP